MNFEEIYDQSYKRVMENDISGLSFFDTFYSKFLDASPEVEKKFKNTDMVAQKKMLKKSFYHLLIFYGSNQADDYIQKIATSHNKAHLGIEPALYDIWLDTLMATLSEYDDKFTDDVELAWRLVLTPGITYMKFKYSHT
ncbi:MAG: globin [Agarilytica sp.]